MARDEERPPIIVRGGSLVIQSGDEKSSNPKHKKGKPWLDAKDKKLWKQKHDNGKHVATYSVSFQGGGGTCSPTFATEVHVTYELTSGGTVEVTIGREKVANGKEMEPFVRSTKELTADNEREQPTLTLPLGGKITSISAGGKVCSNPVSAKLQPVNGKDSDGSRSVRAIVIAVAAIAAVAFAFAFGLFDFNGDEERPPIIVRNGSIVFENQLVSGPSTGQSKLWVPSGTRKWKPDHKEGKRISGFDVTFNGVDCAPMSGHPVRITRTNGAGGNETYEIKREGLFRVDPKVQAPVDMTVDNSIPKTTLTSKDTGGAITEVRIANTTCNIPSTSKPNIVITPK